MLANSEKEYKLAMNKALKDQYEKLAKLVNDCGYDAHQGDQI